MELPMKLEIGEGFSLRHGPAAEFLYKQFTRYKEGKRQTENSKKT
jgi:hypothetical protein